MDWPKVIYAILIFLPLRTHSIHCADGTTITPKLSINPTGMEKALCLQRSDCAPTYDCENPVNVPGHTVCLDDLYDENGDCLVYSFGVWTEWGFELDMGRLGCEVHMFDPTVTLSANITDRVFFHKWGLFGGSINESASAHFTHEIFGKVEGEMKQLDEIKSILGHRGRDLSILKIDCEGCEWESLGNMEPHEHPLRLVKQLLIEFHVSVTLGMNTSHQVDLMGSTFDVLWGNTQNVHHLGQFYHRRNQGWVHDRTILPELVSAGFPNHVCCREVGYVRTGCFSAWGSHQQRHQRALNLARAREHTLNGIESRLIRRSKQVFIVLNGTAHLFPSPGVLYSYGYSFEGNIETDICWGMLIVGLPCCSKGQEHNGCASCVGLIKD